MEEQERDARVTEAEREAVGKVFGEKPLPQCSSSHSNGSSSVENKSGDGGGSSIRSGIEEEHVLSVAPSFRTVPEKRPMKMNDGGGSDKGAKNEESAATTGQHRDGEARQQTLASDAAQQNEQLKEEEPSKKWRSVENTHNTGGSSASEEMVEMGQEVPAAVDEDQNEQNKVPEQPMYHFKKMIGEGAFASVHHAERVADGRSVAIKIIGCKNAKETALAVNEYKLCCHVQGHHNVLRVHEVFIDSCKEETKEVIKGGNVENPEDVLGRLRLLGGIRVPFDYKYLCIVSDLFPEGSLLQVLLHARLTKTEEIKQIRKFRRDNPGTPIKFVPGIPEGVIWDYAHQLLDALQHLHSNNTIHRDMKPANILIADSGKRVVLTDFGLSRFLGVGEYAGTQAGTLHYLSPEQANRHYTFKSDMWGLGCVLHNMCTLKVTKADARVMFMEAVNESFEADLRKDLRGYSPKLIQFTLKLLTKDYKLRPNATEARELAIDG